MNKGKSIVDCGLVGTLFIDIEYIFLLWDWVAEIDI